MCLSFVILFTIFIIVITQKLVLQQPKYVTAKCTETLLPLLVFNSPWVRVLYISAVHTKRLFYDDAVGGIYNIKKQTISSTEQFFLSTDFLNYRHFA